MPILKNSRHERFAQAVAGGQSGTASYIAAGYADQGAGQSASALLQNPNVAERIAELKARAEAKGDMSRGEAIKYLVEILNTPAGDVDKHHKLCQSYDDTEKHSKVTIPEKLGAMNQLAKLCGWNEAEKVQLGASNEITELLKKLRGSG